MRHLIIPPDSSSRRPFFTHDIILIFDYRRWAGLPDIMEDDSDFQKTLKGE